MMVIRNFCRFLADWRNIAALGATCLAIFLTLTFLHSVEAERRSDRQMDREIRVSLEQRRISARRIDILMEQAGHLTSQVVVLREQLIQNGIRPQVVTPARAEFPDDLEYFDFDETLDDICSARRDAQPKK